LPGGILLIDKPKGITSHDVVARVRRELKTKKVGHAGTLDPLASGLLVIGVDAGTKLLSHLFGLDKQYLATIRLGESTTTDDAEGEITFQADASKLSVQEVQSEITKLTGEISQIPSSVSAIKVGGRKAYDIVRSGEEVELKPRQVKIHRFELISEIRRVDQAIEFDVVVDCTTGTYIRALARDIGASLGVGGHIRELRRTMVGEFVIEDAKTLDDLGQPMNLLSVASMLFPVVKLSEQMATDIVHGKKISLESNGPLAASINGKLLAVLQPAGKFYRSLTVFPEAMND
jgi:tRNA pseudouridine55 synthase